MLFGVSIVIGGEIGFFCMFVVLILVMLICSRIVVICVGCVCEVYVVLVDVVWLYDGLFMLKELI